MKGLYSLIITHFFCWSINVHAQIRIEVVKHPVFLTKEPRLFLATNLNGWDAANPDYELKRNEKGNYYIDLPDSLTYFEYKFTQGAWSLVEGNEKGESRPNRIYSREKEMNPQLIGVEILNWELMPAYKFVIKSIPANTPRDATIYLAGNFNNWNVEDPAYKMQKHSDGTYKLLVYSDLNQLEYKFTRGSWESVEGRESGKVRPNRIFAKTDFLTNNNVKDIEIDILSWEDLSGRFNFYSLYDVLMLFAALQGILFILAITGIQDYNRAANKWLVLLMAIVSVAIAIRVLWQHREFAQAYPKMSLVPDFLVFTYAPLFYFYIQKLLFKIEKLPFRPIWHFIPAVLQLLAYMPYFLTQKKIFEIKFVNHDQSLYYIFWTVSITAFIFNVYYWRLSYKAILSYKSQYHNQYSYEQNLHYLNAVLFIQATCLVLWLFSGIFLILNRFIPHWLDYDVVEKSVDIVWLIFSTITYFLGYYAIHQPEVFKMPHVEDALVIPSATSLTTTTIASTPPLHSSPYGQYVTEKTEDKQTNETKPLDDNMLALVQKVDDYLLKNRTYTNPNLFLNELAMQLRMQPHLLSKVINEGFDKNFFDFINSYRIEEFKKLAQDKRYKNHTIISLAYEVGFNSKTAFNRSFKKITNQTPKEYLSLVGSEMIT